MDTGIDYAGVLLAAVVSMSVRLAWHSPSAFGPAWQRLTGINPLKAGRLSRLATVGISIAGAVASALVLSYCLAATGSRDYVSACAVACIAWMGFQLPVLLDQTAWERRAWAWVAIAAGNHLTALLASAIVLVWWNQ